METPKENAYDAEISPLMTQIIGLCQQHKINMFATFALDNHGEDDGGNLMCTTIQSTNDPDDEAGRDTMAKLDSVLRPPRPTFAAFTISTARPR